MFEEIIARVAIALKNHKIPYAIIGGQAVLVHGQPRITRDIDISLGVDADRLPDMLGIVAETGLVPLTKDPKDFVSRTMVLPALDEASSVRVDLIFSNSLFEAEAIKRAKTIKILGQDTSFASPEDLIVHKVIAGRAVDLDDVKSVILRNKDLDLGHIRKWLAAFDQSFEDKRYLETFENTLKKTLDK